MAALNAKSRAATRLMLSRALEGATFVTGSATGGSTTTIVDSSLSSALYPDDYFNGWQIRNQTKDFTTYISDYAAGGTFTFATQTASAASDVYEVHNRAAFRVEDYNDAIDRAIQAAAHHSALADVDTQAIAYQRGRSLYPLPSGFSYIHSVWVDYRPSGRLIRHGSANWDTLTGVKTAATTNVKLAQSFEVLDQNPSFITGDVYLLLSKTGAPTGNATVTIEADSSGSPSGTALITSATVDVSTLTVEPTWVRFTFTATAVLAKDTTYWLVLSSTHSASSTVNIAWANDSTESNYPDGAAKTYDNTSWSTLTGDLVFILRDPYPQLFNLGRGKTHWDVRAGQSTRYLHILPAGLRELDSIYGDGSSFFIEGQGPPSIPTLDSSTINVSYEYVVAKAGLLLAAQNKHWQVPDRGQLGVWAAEVADAEKNMRTQIKDGSIKVEAV